MGILTARRRIAALFCACLAVFTGCTGRERAEEPTSPEPAGGSSVHADAPANAPVSGPGLTELRAEEVDGCAVGEVAVLRADGVELAGRLLSWDELFAAAQADDLDHAVRPAWEDGPDLFAPEERGAFSRPRILDDAAGRFFAGLDGDAVLLIFDAQREGEEDDFSTFALRLEADGGIAGAAHIERSAVQEVALEGDRIWLLGLQPVYNHYDDGSKLSSTVFVEVGFLRLDDLTLDYRYRADWWDLEGAALDLTGGAPAVRVQAEGEEQRVELSGYRPPELNGVWQMGSRGVGASYGACFEFLPDGRVYYTANAMQGWIRVRGVGGRWELEGDLLCLTWTEKYVLEGGWIQEEGFASTIGPVVMDAEMVYTPFAREEFVVHEYKLHAGVLHLGDTPFYPVAPWGMGDYARLLSSKYPGAKGEKLRSVTVTDGTGTAPPSMLALDSDRSSYRPETGTVRADRIENYLEFDEAERYWDTPDTLIASLRYYDVTVCGVLEQVEGDKPGEAEYLFRPDEASLGALVQPVALLEYDLLSELSAWPDEALRSLIEQGGGRWEGEVALDYLSFSAGLDAPPRASITLNTVA